MNADSIADTARLTARLDALVTRFEALGNPTTCNSYPTAVGPIADYDRGYADGFLDGQHAVEDAINKIFDSSEPQDPTAVPPPVTSAGSTLLHRGNNDDR